MSAPAPPKLSLISQTLRSRLPFPTDAVRLVPLAGDASNRRYYRVQLQSGPLQSLIVMQLASPEAFKESEEAVSGAPSPSAELPFINIGRHLAEAEVPVPTLYHYDQAAGLLYLEDFGDTTLTQTCLSATPQRVRQLYRTAITTLVRIHTRASRPSSGCLAFQRAFDVPLLMWEFDHFLEYGVAARLGRAMAPADEKQVRGEFYKIAEVLAEQPRVFTHRDYHSRNLMVRDLPDFGASRLAPDASRTTDPSPLTLHPSPILGVLDFQDALLGPATYDLASLLRDAYLALDEPLLDELIVAYLEGMAAHGITWPDQAAFRRLFDLTSIQRNLKAAGRFVYIDRVKKNPAFLADIPRVLGYVRRNLAKYSELAALCAHLSPYVPELQ
jgi:aminoglycoside/choline kinase family phosphotransferase